MPADKKAERKGVKSSQDNVGFESSPNETQAKGEDSMVKEFENAYRKRQAGIETTRNMSDEESKDENFTDRQPEEAYSRREREERNNPELRRAATAERKAINKKFEKAVQADMDERRRIIIANGEYPGGQVETLKSKKGFFARFFGL